MLGSWCARLAARAPRAKQQPARAFWWGHDTIEDKEARAKADKEKGIICWTDPNKDIAEKKEFTWAPARIEQEAMTSLSVFDNMLGSHADLISWMDRKVMRPTWITWLTDPVHFRETMRRKAWEHRIVSQVFLRERLEALGPDLAAAHFLCHRNCRVRFRGHTDWTELNEDGSLDLPALYVPGWHIEAIDAATAELVYEGFQNFRNLEYLKWLDLSYCEYFDEWCLDRVTGEHGDSLEYLNISGCRSLDWNGLECIWRLRKLKTLVIKDMDHVKDLTLLCLMLLDVMPGLQIVGADYLDLELLEGTNHAGLLEDVGFASPRLESGQSVENEERVAKNN